MPYVDGYVVPVPKKNLQAYARIARWPEKFGEIMALLRFGSASPTI
jgi:uncharacterized protein YbaA (DUF1428 family)